MQASIGSFTLGELGKAKASTKIKKVASPPSLSVMGRRTVANALPPPPRPATPPPIRFNYGLPPPPLPRNLVSPRPLKLPPIDYSSPGIPVPKIQYPVDNNGELLDAVEQPSQREPGKYVATLNTIDRAIDAVVARRQGSSGATRIDDTLTTDGASSREREQTGQNIGRAAGGALGNLGDTVSEIVQKNPLLVLGGVAAIVLYLMQPTGGGYSRKR